MEQIEHRAFLKKNKTDKKLLLTAIQDKIKIFDKMYDLLERITPCGKGSLIGQLEKYDEEIMKDIYNVYGDAISNNELSEDFKAKNEKPKKVVAKAKVNSDEFIIDQLVELGQTEDIGRSTLMDLGLKTPLEWNTIIGKYLIKRISVFKYRYNILIRGEVA
ncbi:hypothetical protein U8527_10415 [Kordia algicida OT-1]|uniref:Uncharacterized protein n=1 Tax=Kordia algicida OT-1 TaxID=391587 RepID=A9DW72_9FLAO|nr:hypothetical protein [Kordia algicida]EDP96519.1 hypothetical protein KAOT1_03882 [Kordia algicida OT-1]